RQSRLEHAAIREPRYRVLPLRSVARGELDIRRVGTLPWFVSGGRARLLIHKPPRHGATETFSWPARLCPSRRDGVVGVLPRGSAGGCIRIPARDGRIRARSRHTVHTGLVSDATSADHPCLRRDRIGAWRSLDRAVARAAGCNAAAERVALGLGGHGC